VLSQPASQPARKSQLPRASHSKAHTFAFSPGSLSQRQRLIAELRSRSDREVGGVAASARGPFSRVQRRNERITYITDGKIENLLKRLGGAVPRFVLPPTRFERFSESRSKRAFSMFR
jgi:hypothetical protein